MDGAADDRYRAMGRLAAATAAAVVIATTAVVAMGVLNFDRAPPATSVATSTSHSGAPTVGHLR